jgi:hypothetical protein
MFGTGDLSDSMALLSCKNPYFDWLRVKPVTAEASKGTQCAPAHTKPRLGVCGRLHFYL